MTPKRLIALKVLRDDTELLEWLTEGILQKLCEEYRLEPINVITPRMLHLIKGGLD